MTNQSGTITIDNFQLNYRIEGEGLPVLVIGDTNYYPRTFSLPLRQHLQMIFINHRGFASYTGEPQQQDYEFDVILNDIEHIRQTLGLEEVAVMGHSGHAFMALEYAKKFPQHVSHVVMLGAAPDFSQASQDFALKYWDENASAERKQVLAQQMELLATKDLGALSPSQRFIQEYIHSGAKIWYDTEFDSAPLWKNVEINMPIFGYIWGNVFRDIDITKGLDKFNLPVMIAVGRYDYPAPPELWNDVQSEFNKLAFHVFEKSGHTPQYEEPELFDRELLSFLQNT